jgi:hypothetical protein
VPVHHAIFSHDIPPADSEHDIPAADSEHDETLTSSHDESKKGTAISPLTVEELHELEPEQDGDSETDSESAHDESVR